MRRVSITLRGITGLFTRRSMNTGYPASMVFVRYQCPSLPPQIKKLLAPSKTPATSLGAGVLLFGALLRIEILLTSLLAGRNKPGAVFIVARFPNDHDLIYRHETKLVVVVLEMKHPIFNFQYFATQT